MDYKTVMEHNQEREFIYKLMEVESLREGIPKSKKVEPWENVQLTKSERKGKTDDEVKQLRKAKWERICNSKS